MYKLLLLIIILVAGLVLYLLQPDCPTNGTFETDWNTWSFQYLSDNPGVTVEMQMEAWNQMMLERSCNEWLNPLDDLIQQHGDSGIPVYWYVP